MEINPNYLENLKKIKNTSKIQEWQEYALEVINEFNIHNSTTLVVDKNGKDKWITKNYKAMIFRHACNNLQYLKGKVELCRDRFNGDVQGKGNYLISLFRKQKPWEKK